MSEPQNMYGSSRFGYASAVVERYPAVRAGIVHATGLANGPSPPGLIDAYTSQQKATADRLATTPIAEIPSIKAWRQAFTRFGAKPTQHRNAAEALLRRIGKQGDIPSINTLVDIGNLVSIRHALPVAVFDLGGIAGTITVGLAEGTEPFTDLGAAGATVSPDPGEVVFVDEEGVVCARRWCWRQSAQSATTSDTVEALAVVEGLHETAAQDVAAAVADLRALLASHQPQSQNQTTSEGGRG